MGTVVGEPARHQFRLTFAEFPRGGEHAGVHAQARKIFEIFGVLTAYPGAVGCGVLGIANADWHFVAGSSCAASRIDEMLEDYCLPGRRFKLQGIDTDGLIGAAAI